MLVIEFLIFKIALTISYFFCSCLFESKSKIKLKMIINIGELKSQIISSNKFKIILLATPLIVGTGIYLYYYYNNDCNKKKKSDNKSNRKKDPVIFFCLIFFLDISFIFNFAFYF